MDLMKKVGEAVPEILKEVYGDLAKPGAQQAGKALGTIVGLGNTILWPVEPAFQAVTRIVCSVKKKG